MPEIHKICSWSLTHRRLIESIGSTNLGLLIDTGPCDEKLLMEINKWYKCSGGSQLAVLHDFHSKDFDQMNFGSIRRIKELLKSPVGYTPQGREMELDIFALGIGANMLEKRLTKDSYRQENGHFKALEPDEFAHWCNKVRTLKSPMEQMKRLLHVLMILKLRRKDAKFVHHKSLSLATFLHDSIYEKRPGTGIPANLIYNYIGKTVKVPIQAGQMLSKYMVDLNLIALIVIRCDSSQKWPWPYKTLPLWQTI